MSRVIPGLFSRPLAFLFAAFAITVAQAAPATAGILITIDKSAQEMSVAVDGKTRWVWPVSTGRRGYATPSGSFGAFRMEEDHYSKEWDDAPMPHSIFFTKQGHAIHGTFEAKRLGSAASHGCVRLSTRNAAQLFALVKEEGLTNTKVVVTGEQPATATARRPSAPQVAETDEPVAVSPRYGQPQGGYYYSPGYQQGYGQPYRPSPYYYPPVTPQYPSYPRPYRYY